MGLGGLLMPYVVATPAYGRDYKSQKEVKAAWDAGLDFQCQPYGQYVNKEDAEKLNITVQVRYDRLRKVMVLP